MKIFTSLLAATCLASAHPDPSHTLEHLDEHLAESPDDTDLLRQKAILLLESGHPHEVPELIARLLSLEPEQPRNLLLDAKLQSSIGHTESSIRKLREIVSNHPKFAPAWDFLASQLKADGRCDEAIDAKIRFLRLAEKPSPSDVMTCAAWLRDRAEDGDKSQAIDILDRGLEKLGCLSGLQKMAIDLELELKRYDSALRRIDLLTARFRPSVALCTQRAEIEWLAGRKSDAWKSYDAAIALLDALPLDRRAEPQVQAHRAVLSERIADCLRPD